jgi:hypothetical protein
MSKTVAELGVNCTYPINDGECGRPASTVVIDAKDNQSYRCLEHQGQVRAGIRGTIRYRMQNPPN